MCVQVQALQVQTQYRYFRPSCQSVFPLKEEQLPANCALIMALQLLLALALPALSLSQRVVVLGSSGGGFSAAIAAARGGASVTLLETAGNGGGTGTHIGGMVTGGLSHADCGNASVIGGIAREFFERVERQYPNRSTDPNLQPNSGPPCWLYEPHVAEQVMWASIWQRTACASSRGCRALPRRT